VGLDDDIGRCLMISTKNAWGEILTQTHLGTLVTSVLFEFSRSKPASAKLTLLNLPLNTGTEFPIRSPSIGVQMSTARYKGSWTKLLPGRRFQLHQPPSVRGLVPQKFHNNSWQILHTTPQQPAGAHCGCNCVCTTRVKCAQ
jgi:hypothetical protein